MPAKVMVLDFSEGGPGTIGGKNVPEQKVLMTKKKQIRRRVRRRGVISLEEFETLYKPLDEWDDEELARGRPRDKNGGFSGAAPMWITRQMHEEILNRFKKVVKRDMRKNTLTALTVVHHILTDQRVDPKGKPLVPASTRLDAAKFLIEHEIGKPTQEVKSDVSIKLQAVLANVTASPVDGVGAAALVQGPENQYGTAQDFADAYGIGPGSDVVDAEVVDEDEYDDD